MRSIAVQDCPSPMITRGPSCPSSFTTYGQDGAGRRMEAVLTCIATAHALKLQYVHTPFHVLQHGVDVARANRFLGLPPCWATLEVARATAHCGKCPPAAIHPSPHYMLGTTYIVDDEFSCGSNGRAASSNNRTSTLAQLSSSSSLAASTSRCVLPDDNSGRRATVHVAYHCFRYFWCTIVRDTGGRAWFEVLPALRTAYFAAHPAAAAAAAAAAVAAPPPHNRRRSAARDARDAADNASVDIAITTPSMDEAQRGAAAAPPASAATAILVGLHHRSVKRRARVSNVIYGSLVSALRERHSAYLRANPAASSPAHPRGLRFIIHSDTRIPAAVRNHSSTSTGPAGILPTLARAADVTLRTPDDVHDPLDAMHELSLADVLIPSASSFSMVPALLGNMTVLLPACFSRAPLPH